MPSAKLSKSNPREPRLETPRTRKIRLMAGAMILLLWIPALALGVEVYERARVEMGNRLFPMMLNYRMSHQFGMKFVDPATAETPRPAPATVPLTAPASPPERSTAPPDQAHLDRAVLAAAQREMHMRVRDDGHIIEAWGEPAIETHLRHRLALALRDPATVIPMPQFMAPTERVEFEYSFFFSTINRFYSVTVSPEREAGERVIFARERTHEMPYEELSFGDPSPGGLWLAPFYAYRPNYRGEEDIESNNNFGFWDHDVVVPKPHGVFRIVCVGGSTTHEGPSMDATYPKRVQAHLRARFGDHIEVINAGVIGNTSFNIRTRIDHYLKMEPDLLLYYGGVNDVCHQFFTLWLELRDDKSPWLERSYALRRIYNRSLLPPDDDIRSFLRRTIVRNLAAARVHAQLAGADLVVSTFLFPDPERLRWRDRLFLDANMTASWGGQGLINYDTWCAIMTLLNDELTVWSQSDGGPTLLPVADHFTGGAESFADTCHVTEYGMVKKSRVFADLLGDYLAQRPEFQ